MHYSCIMPIPSLQLQEKRVSRREQEGLVMELWSPRFVTILSCAMRLLQTNEQIELFATVGWKWGCQPCSCRCWQNVTHCKKEICSTCLFKESIPAIPVWEFQAPTFYQKLKVSESGSRLHHLCITVASCPSLRCSCRKNLSYAEKQRVWSWSCGLQHLLQCSDCALSSAM